MMAMVPTGTVVAGRRLTMRVTSMQRDRLQWLRERPRLLARLPSTNQDVEGDRQVALDEAHRAMRAAGLVSPHASPDAARWSLRLLVSRLRGEHIHG